MAQSEVLSPKLVIRINEYARDFRAHCHYCPACDTLHGYAVEQPFPSNGAKWSFDGNVERPTFLPSMNISWGPLSDGTVRRCHYFVRNGQIEYCGDSTHAMAGQTVELPDIPERFLR